MRSFDERMDEIKRRSQTIFAQRKKQRKQLLLTCVPLVLCLVVLGGIWLGTPGKRPQTPTASVPRLEVSGAEFKRDCTDSQTVQQLQDLLAHCQTSSLLNDSVNLPTKSDPHGTSPYTITLVTEAGETLYYRLVGNKLTDEISGQVTLLTPKQLREITALLGIPDNGLQKG